MKKVCVFLILFASVYVFVKNATVDAATRSPAPKQVSVELTVNSPGADGLQFVLNGLQTPATPTYACTDLSSLSDAAGNGNSVHFAVADLKGVDQIKLTVNGTAVGNLYITNDRYFDQSGNYIAGRVSVKQLR